MCKNRAKLQNKEKNQYFNKSKKPLIKAIKKQNKTEKQVQKPKKAHLETMFKNPEKLPHKTNKNSNYFYISITTIGTLRSTKNKKNQNGQHYTRKQLSV